mgnify:CR=1 FL=1
MNKNKRERLRRAGWTIGSVTEFLGLTEAEAALVELKLTLSRRLKERRARSRLSASQEVMKAAARRRRRAASSA